MMDMDIIIYQPFVNEIKELIQRKQFQAIKIVNTETINLTGKSVKRYIVSKEKRDGENPLYRYWRRSCKRSSQEHRDIQRQICGECVIFI